MKIYIFPIFTISVILILIARVFLKKATTGFDESVEEFMQKEEEANYTTKNFEELDLKYIYPNKDILPFKEYDEADINLKNVIKKQSLVLRKIELEMIKLPLGLNNTDLKLNYGINNFDKITILEQHYNSFIRALFEWAEVLYDINEKEDCEVILAEAIRLEGDISHIYILMCEIYFEQNNKEKIIQLKNLVESYELSLKDKIINFLDEKINLM